VNHLRRIGPAVLGGGLETSWRHVEMVETASPDDLHAASKPPVRRIVKVVP
jgi:hypothetical protein